MTDNNRRAHKRMCSEALTMHNNKRSAARHIVRVDPAEPMNKQEKKKWIPEQLKPINAALAECF